jgi:hypothetical protein
VTDKEMLEAWYLIVKAAHAGKQVPGPYHLRYLGWLQGGMPPYEAYCQRSTMYRKAKCFLQAAEDARAAVAALRALLAALPSAEEDTGKSSATEGAHGDKDAFKKDGQDTTGGVDIVKDRKQQRSVLRLSLADAYLRLGEALLAEPGHEDRDPRGAAKALIRAADLDSQSIEARDRLQEASEALTLEQLESATREVYNEGSSDPGEAEMAETMGALRAPRRGERAFLADVELAFPKAGAADLRAEARELLRCGAAAAAGVPPSAVAIAGALPPVPAKRRPFLLVRLHAQVGPHLLKGQALVDAVKAGGRDVHQLDVFLFFFPFCNPVFFFLTLHGRSK